MIRNVVLGRVKDDASDEDLAKLRAGLNGIASLTPPGLVANHIGVDLGLRDGGWSWAITNDWVDADAYRGYDQEAEHNRYRAMIVDVCSAVARVQFEIPD